MLNHIVVNDKQLTAVVNQACLAERKGRKFIAAHIVDEMVYLVTESDTPSVHSFISIDMEAANGTEAKG